MFKVKSGFFRGTVVTRDILTILDAFSVIEVIFLHGDLGSVV